MKVLNILNSSYNLLFNLLMRECNSWYFLNIIPKHDEHLALYMKSCQTLDFVRFDLKNDHRILYFPIHYKSLTGMHVFGNHVGIRTERFGKIEIITMGEALIFLMKEQFPETATPQFYATIDHVTDIYNELIEKRTFKLFSDVAPILSDKKAKENNEVALSNLVHEYSTKEELAGFHQLLSDYAGNSNTDIGKAAILWLKSYTDCLLQSVVNKYTEEGIITAPNLLNTIITTDQEGLPAHLSFSNSNYILKNDLPEYFNIRKIENFLQTQLLTHNLFPVIRALGLSGINTEAKLLEEVSHSMLAFYNLYSENKNFIFHSTVFVDFFLPSIFSIHDTEHIHSQANQHNHLINSKYYSDKLIKPEKGELVHKRYFENSVMEIGIRAFDIDTDLDILYEWVNKDYAKKFWEMDGPIEELEEAYIKLLGVDYSHPYIGTLNGEPIFTLELYWAVKDEVGKYYPFHPGDYGFHMLIAPAKKKINNFSYYALTMCMEHFFSHSQVHRMIGEASVDHAGTHNLITKVGCEFSKALTLPYKTSNLTFLNREMYKDAVQDILDTSCSEIYLKV
ncbi:GNAT family N-acetyltransferase [Chryseobacterium sp.]|uniref:GNAT family N-acetyltransferase n=1 Tax=Chryseobacterium sp. TaxID=1871047 RepID=UPI0025C338D3|nr:GNAT family N-acetyltransferase [Chryseobacterium sp.]